MDHTWSRRLGVTALVTAVLALGWITAPSLAGGTKVKEGEAAPKVDLPATQIDSVLPDKKDAKTLNLSEFKGKKNVVLYFYPKALTGGWTAEACGFRDRIEQFAQLNTVVVGISTDTLALQKKFTEKEKLNFPLYADADQKVAKAFGALIPGRPLARRCTFVIDKEGKIAKIYDPVKNAGGHPQEVLDYVKEHLAK